MNNKNPTRVELHLHTKLSDDSSVITPKELIETAVRMGCKAVAVTDKNSVQSFFEIAKCREEYGNDIKVIYGAEVCPKEDFVTVLAKDKTGLKALYKIISKKEIAPHERGHILIGSGKTPLQKLMKNAAEFDYIELFISNDKAIQEHNKALFDLGKSLGIPVVAVGNCHYIEPCHKVFKDILDFAKDKDTDDTPSHFPTIEEMLKEFSYLGEEGAFEAVITNPNRIADSIDFIDPTGKDFPLFTLPDAHKEIKRICKEKVTVLYGENPPKEFTERLNAELDLLKDNHCSIYLLMHKLSAHLRDIGAVSGCRGTDGSTMTAYLLGISDVNPLPPHYRCPECKHTEFADTNYTADGFDLPLKGCPVCSNPMEGDGHNIPFETRLGSKSDRCFNMDIATTDSAQEEAMRFITDYLGNDRVAMAGTVACYMHRFAQEAIDSFEKHSGKKLSEAEIDRVSEKIIGTKRANGTHPAGIVLLPEGAEWEDITPMKPCEPSFGNIRTATHRDYFSLADHLHKINITGYEVYDKLQRLFEVTRTHPTDINFNDPQVLKLLGDMDFHDIPELSHEIFGEIFGKISEKQEEVNFSTLVKALSMAHGTDVWRVNGEILINRHPFSQLIGNRDDVYLMLLSHGIDTETAHTITEKVWKGRFRIKNTENEKLREIMKSANVPLWYMDSMTRIHYLFPKSHAVRYAKSAFISAWFKVYYPKEFHAVMSG